MLSATTRVSRPLFCSEEQAAGVESSVCCARVDMTVVLRAQRWRGSFNIHPHAHAHLFNGLCPGLPGCAGTRKVKRIWILLKQETVSGSGISWAICESAPRSRQTTTPAPHHTVFFYPPDALNKDSQRNNRMTQVQAVRTQLKVVLMRNAEVGKYQCAVFAQTRLL